LARALYTVVTAITSRVWIRCVEMPTSASSALQKALRHSRIAGPARDARAVTFCGAHGLGLGKISCSKQYRLGTPPPPVTAPAFNEDVSSIGGLYHSTSKRAFIGLIVTYICSSIGLFTAVMKFPFRRCLSFTCLSSAHRHCNRLLWSKPTLWTTISQCGPQSHNVGTPHNAFPQDKLGLWSYPG